MLIEFVSLCLALIIAPHCLAQGLIDNAPTASPVATCLSRPLLLSCGGASESREVLPANCVLPVRVLVPASLPAGVSKGCVQILAGATEPSDAATLLGELVFQLEGAGASEEALTIALAVTEQGEILVEVTHCGPQLLAGSITIPATA